MTRDEAVQLARGVERFRDCLEPGGGGPRLVPHLARVAPHKANGPLFGGRE